MLYDALPTEKRLRDLMITCMAPHGDVLVIPGPIKGVPRIDQKTAEKYGGRFDQVKDVTRITIDCPSITVKYTVVEVLLDEDALARVLLDFKDRLDRMKCNPADSGGYLDLPFSSCSQGPAHTFEVHVPAACNGPTSQHVLAQIVREGRGQNHRPRWRPRSSCSRPRPRPRPRCFACLLR